MSWKETRREYARRARSMPTEQTHVSVLAKDLEYLCEQAEQTELLVQTMKPTSAEERSLAELQIRRREQALDHAEKRIAELGRLLAAARGEAAREPHALDRRYPEALAVLHALDRVDLEHYALSLLIALVEEHQSFTSDGCSDADLVDALKSSWRVADTIGTRA